MIHFALVLAQTITPTPPPTGTAIGTPIAMFGTAQAGGFFGALSYIPDLPHFSPPSTPLLNINVNDLFAHIFAQGVWQGVAVWEIGGTAWDYLTKALIALILVKVFLTIFGRLTGSSLVDPIHDILIEPRAQLKQFGERVDKALGPAGYAATKARAETLAKERGTSANEQLKRIDNQGGKRIKSGKSSR